MIADSDSLLTAGCHCWLVQLCFLRVSRTAGQASRGLSIDQQAAGFVSRDSHHSPRCGQLPMSGEFVFSTDAFMDR